MSWGSDGDGPKFVFGLLAFACIVVVAIHALLNPHDYDADCRKKVYDRGVPCIPGTVQYDGDDECECISDQGEYEIEFDLDHYHGCAGD